MCLGCNLHHQKSGLCNLNLGEQQMNKWRKGEPIIYATWLAHTVTGWLASGSFFPDR
jgi:hypothetical protein